MDLWSSEWNVDTLNSKPSLFEHWQSEDSEVSTVRVNFSSFQFPVLLSAHHSNFSFISELWLECAWVNTTNDQVHANVLSFNLPPYLVVPYLWIQENPSAIKWSHKEKKKSPQFVNKWKGNGNAGWDSFCAESLQIADRYCMIVNWSILKWPGLHAETQPVKTSYMDEIWYFHTGSATGFMSMPGSSGDGSWGMSGYCFPCLTPTHQVHSGFMQSFSWQYILELVKV